ncbi:hydroxyacylglutathione hydrolase [Metapseudomonas furukawaii]|jgi:hydroxyacylglutathione hydrolase|uniref:Hydroxyacylglutathione hydrolase n=1 Tax=Metapseudomonas furukawaii TaxID=1149133 RepID=A0AAD1BZ10_METFU|nr:MULTISPECIES: hydroxyacylglutathione hydrolase [Pseudomonas]ELS28935.1 Hydroxyacylglutathione hydrolase [Pseudomonas furukawaii]OWJ94805.1 hydroxyacylglutathione hydrolase [Pseudomonas sp. A46]WAG80870.1 hydroxyacylglutathione hydrolase [Pseudomonas furukawaii]BAU73710.1 hydroxyacylglutathione hydrolase [Pseudomonas furukawaii]
MIKIDALPAFSDNYLWLLQDEVRHTCAVVDPGDAAPVLAWLEAHPGWRLTDILVTHHHHDHVGGVARLKEASGARVLGPAREQIPVRDEALEDGDRVLVLGLEFQVLDVPGHTAGHIAYYHEDQQRPLLFCGDTLFAAGCGRLFEGTPEQMHRSLSRLAALPETTLVYCTHEYTLSNLRFARAVEPGNAATAARFEALSRLREAGGITLPSTIALERATNPFLRADETSVKQMADERAGRDNATPTEVFATLRAWKDSF